MQPQAARRVGLGWGGQAKRDWHYYNLLLYSKCEESGFWNPLLLKCLTNE